MPSLFGKTPLEKLSELQHWNTKEGMKEWIEEQTEIRIKTSPPRNRKNNSSPKSSALHGGSNTVDEIRQKVLEEDKEDLPIGMGPRPMTAPIRPKTPLLTPELEMKFDSAAPRPWTANTLDDANQMNNDESSNGMPSSSSFIQKEESQKHIRLSQLVQAPVEHMDTAKHVVEDATGCQLKDSRKVFQGLLEKISSAFTVKVVAGRNKPTEFQAKPKKTKFKFSIKEKLSGGLVIILDPLSNLDNNLVSIKATHKIAKIPVTEEYLAIGTGNAFNIDLTTLVDATYEESTAVKGKIRSFPGWNGRPPIWIPVPYGSLQLKVIQKPRRIMTRRFSIGMSHVPDKVGKEFKLPKEAISANFLIFSASTPKNAILMLRSFMEKIERNTVESLTVGGGIPAINIACLHGNSKAVEQLLMSGANPNSRRDNMTQYSALHECVLGGHDKLVVRLLEGGANQLLRDAAGNNPLHLACALNDIRCIRALVADANQRVVRRSLNAENGKRLKPHHECIGAYCKSIIEGIMSRHNLAVRNPRQALQT